MGFEGWLTSAVVVAMVLLMGLAGAAPDLVLVAGLSVLLAMGAVDLSVAFEGFANPAVLTIAALFVVAKGMQETGATDIIARRVLGRSGRLAVAQLRMMLPVSAMSAFLNNTPVVAMMVPIVNDWARRTKLSASMLLMPLSYAAILGGTCTLIGTSTNLVVAGMAKAHDPSLGFGMFDIAWLGVPAVIVGTAYVTLVSRWLLTDRTAGSEAFDHAREYTVLMRVEADSPVVGSTIEDAGLRQLPGLFLVEIQRQGVFMPAVGPDTRILADDQLLFAGIVDSVVDLRKIRGLVPDTDQVTKLERSGSRRLVEAVVAARSSLVGRTIRDSRFRTRYGGAIIAVNRQGERIRSKVGDIVVNAGDVLLIEATSSFLRSRRRDPDFALVAEVAGSRELRHERAWLASVILLLMVALSALGVLELVVAALLAATAMVVFRCLRGAEARRSIELEVLLAVAAAIGIGAALEQSGAAAALGAVFYTAMEPFGPLGLLAGIYTVTAALAGIVSTKAAAALMFPVVASAASGMGLPLVPCCYVLMIAASTAFSTPIGFQTNLMVLGPGGYHFSDFLRLGLPLQALLGGTTVSMAWWVWF